MEPAETTVTTPTPATTPTSIASLSPALDELGKRRFHAVVTLVWPYSSASRRISLLLADPDFRLRAANGQVKVHFVESAAEEILRLRISIGDHLLLSLDGARWEKQVAKVGILANSIDWELSYSDRLQLEVQRHSTTVASLDWKFEPPQTHEKPPETPVSKPTTQHRSFLTSDWASPAFTKRLAEFTPRKAPALPSTATQNEEEEVEEDGYIHGIGRKRPKFGRPSGEWTFVEAPASPVASVKDLDEELELAVSRAILESDDTDTREPIPPQPIPAETTSIEESRRSTSANAEEVEEDKTSATPKDAPPISSIDKQVEETQIEQEDERLIEQPATQQPPSMPALLNDQYPPSTPETYSKLHLLSDAAQRGSNSPAPGTQWPAQTQSIGDTSEYPHFRAEPVQQNIHENDQTSGFGLDATVRSTTPDGEPPQTTQDIALQALNRSGETQFGGAGGGAPGWGVYRDQGTEDSDSEGADSDDVQDREAYREEDYYNYTTMKNAEEESESEELEEEEEEYETEPGAEGEEGVEHHGYDEGYDQYYNKTDGEGEEDNEQDEEEESHDERGQQKEAEDSSEEEEEEEEERGRYTIRRQHEEEEEESSDFSDEEDEEDEDLRREADAAARAPPRTQSPEIIELDSDSEDEDEEVGQLNQDREEEVWSQEAQSDATDDSMSENDTVKAEADADEYVNQAATLQDHSVPQGDIQAAGEDPEFAADAKFHETESGDQSADVDEHNIPQSDFERTQEENAPGAVEEADVDPSPMEIQESGQTSEPPSHKASPERAIEDVSNTPVPGVQVEARKKVAATTEFMVISSGESMPMEVENEAVVETVASQGHRVDTVAMEGSKVETVTVPETVGGQDEYVKASTTEGVETEVVPDATQKLQEQDGQFGDDQQTEKHGVDTTSEVERDEAAATGPATQQSRASDEVSASNQEDKGDPETSAHDPHVDEEVPDEDEIEQGETTLAEFQEEELSDVSRSPSPTMQLHQELFAFSTIADTGVEGTEDVRMDIDQFQQTKEGGALLEDKFLQESIEFDTTRVLESSELHSTQVSTEDDTDSILDADLPGPNPGAEGYRSRTSYYNPLSTLVNTFGAQVDAMAIVLDAGEAEPASAKSSFYSLYFEVTEPSMSGLAVPVQIVKAPGSEALPSVRRGDVILLRDFTVRTLDHRVMLVSSDVSAWAVFDKPDGTVEDVQVNGRPVELGTEELDFANRLRDWFSEEGLALAIKQGAKRRALQRFSTPTEAASFNSSLTSSQYTAEDPSQSQSQSQSGSADGAATPRTRARRMKKKANMAREKARRITIHQMRYGRQYTEVGSPPAKDILHELRDGTTWSDI
ncbi:hypothetical protein KEM56_003797 [Ascosphaera pollenicola]|nr:hypothetical protein KEM56_003797 [Ascosphaera pollenicola]